MKRKVIAVALTAVMLAATALTGCSPAAPAVSETIKIGWMGSLSGDQAVWGECELNTVKMLVEDQNAKGGIYGKKLEVVGYDTKGDPQEAVNVAKRLTGQDKVVAIIGPNASGSAIPIASVLEASKVADIATVATNPKVTVMDGKVKPYNYRVCFIDPYQGAVAAGYASDVLKFKNAAILYDTGDDYSQGLTQYFEETFVKKGGKIVAKEGFKSGDVDFRPQLSKIKAAKPDIIFMPYFFKEVALSSTQARELGIKAALMGGDGWPSDQLLTMAKDAVNGAYFVNHLDFNDPAVKEFKEKYKTKYSKEVELNGFLANDAFLMLMDAMTRAGAPDSDKIAKALETTNIQGITGKISIGAQTHNPEGKEAAIIKIEDGKYVFQQRFSVTQ